MQLIKKFSEISLQDLPLVGGKNASLGEMIQALGTKLRISAGFAVTADAYWYFLKHNNLVEPVTESLAQWQNNKITLEQASKKIRSIIEAGNIPTDLQQAIIDAYQALCKEYKQSACDVAVRSSATAEDLPTASFAGQQESFLNVQGGKALINAYIKCLSSLFTPRAMIYRQEHNFDHMRVGISVGIQKMIRSDQGCAGVAFTLDTETGFKDVVFINGSWGLGEAIVQGIVNPDSFYVHKPTLAQGFKSILQRKLGSKKTKVIYSTSATKTIATTTEEQQQFCLTNQEILELAQMCCAIEAHYSEKNNAWTPMDIEWAKDGIDGKLYIVQARPETIHHKNNNSFHTRYELSEPASARKVLLTGQSIGQKIAHGIARVVKSVKDINIVQTGDIIITTMTDPDWVPVMKKAAAIVTDTGGRTCHAAIVSRELGIPAIVGTNNATSMLKTNQEVTVDCSQGEIGYIYEGKLPFTVEKIAVQKQGTLPIKLYMNIGDPDQAFRLAGFPVDGVGLARLEFIIANTIKIHPMALVHPEKITDKKIADQIKQLTTAYPSYRDFFIDKLAEQAGTLAAAFYPRPVIIRLSDFKSNEYRNLIGGEFFEPIEENPMIGLRGASRYYSSLYEEAFVLECLAMKKIRDEMGLTNTKIMIPFVRTTDEMQKVEKIMQQHGLTRGTNDLEIIMMCEIPSNVILIDQFSKYVDGFSIGSNDLTQMTLAIDRDSSALSGIFNEQNEAVIAMITLAIEGTHRHKKTIGICGQGPSDHPELADFLIDIGIDSISLNPDSILPFLARYKK